MSPDAGPPADDAHAAALWSDLLRRLRESVGVGAYSTFSHQAAPRSFDGATFEIGVANDLTRELFLSTYRAQLADAVESVCGPDVNVDLRVDAAAFEPASVEPRDDDVPEPAFGGRLQPLRPESQPAGIANPKYTFDNFVIGSHNRFAHAAALAVAEAPASSWNPLFIYGGTGLGKTHLLQAIAAYVSAHSELSTRYVTTEAFMNDFIDSLRDKRTDGFKQRYRNYDVLLVDDVQFLEGKERIQEEFFHTFNSLHQAGRQIVLCSDRPPKEIRTLEHRLRTRFEWGLITDIQPPDLETRIAILRKKVATDDLAIGNEEVLTFIASRVSSNIRELEGALTRVLAYTHLTAMPPTVAVAEEVLCKLFPGEEAQPVTIERIQDVVCSRFDIPHAELIGQKRHQAVTYPRQVAMYLCRELTSASLPRIGKEFGGRDHTTVIHATSKIKQLISQDRAVYNLVQDLTAAVKARP
ncbi:MAG: chromosomal replication initiator protein DnaA [Gaiella sp.]